MSSYLDICKKYNFPVSKNAIGATGENIAKAILELFPNFRVVFLGEKFPIVDFYIEFTEDDYSYPFLAQIKTTTSTVSKNKCLKVSVPKDKYMLLHKKPIPTYVGGVHVDTVSLYIEATSSNKNQISSIKPNCVLSLDNQDLCAENINKIKNDVKAFWDNLKAFEIKQKYNSILK